MCDILSLVHWLHFNPCISLWERIINMSYVITDDCIQCGACEPECPESAIAEVNGLYVVDASKCQDCGSCADVCPTGAIQAA